MEKIALIVIGYDKADSMLRLLDSLQKADYGADEVPLIISIDNSGSDAVERAADAFSWAHGKKEVRTFQKRQGLRRHILSCGDYLKRYEAVFVFEDDLVASPYFYRYGKACIDYYGKNEAVEGISLYGAKWNYGANFPFEPIKSEHDTYFLQYAQSWGQIWLRERFEAFFAWYCENEDFFEGEKRKDIPENLYTWGKNSWLKYHIAYCVLKKKYFVYPYYSYTTAFVEKGTHFGTDIARFQSEMMIRDKEAYQFADLDDNAVCYDVFFENMHLKGKLEKEWQESVTVDLYGCKQMEGQSKVLLSTQILPYEIRREYALQLRPIELNVYMNVKGTGIYVYDLTQRRAARAGEKDRQIVRKWNYFMRDRFLMWDEIAPLCRQKLGNLLRIACKKRKRR